MKLLVLSALLAAAFAVPTPSVATAGHGCDRKFDAAVKQDMETFANYDLAGWRAVHAPEAVTIFANGSRAVGFDAIAKALKSHFDGREAVWTYAELNRVVDDCRTGYILYDTTYAIPRIGFSQRAIVGVTYTYRHGRWLVIADQNTLAP